MNREKLEGLADRWRTILRAPEKRDIANLIDAILEDEDIAECDHNSDQLETILSATDDSGKDISRTCDSGRDSGCNTGIAHERETDPTTELSMEELCYPDDLLGDLCDAESIHEPELVHFQGRPKTTPKTTPTPEEVVEALHWGDTWVGSAGDFRTLQWAVRELAKEVLRGDIQVSNLARAITEDTGLTD